jgi:hypothetical protein
MFPVLNNLYPSLRFRARSSDPGCTTAAEQEQARRPTRLGLVRPAHDGTRRQNREQACSLGLAALLLQLRR